MTILERMKAMCLKNGYRETPNLEKIARAKTMMFEDQDWARCPCDGSNSARSCISELCRQDIETKGICHCNCYKR